MTLEREGEAAGMSKEWENPIVLKPPVLTPELLAEIEAEAEIEEWRKAARAPRAMRFICSGCCSCRR